MKIHFSLVRRRVTSPIFTLGNKNLQPYRIWSCPWLTWPLHFPADTSCGNMILEVLLKVVNRWGVNDSPMQWELKRLFTENILSLQRGWFAGKKQQTQQKHHKQNPKPPTHKTTPPHFSTSSARLFRKNTYHQCWS